MKKVNCLFGLILLAVSSHAQLFVHSSNNVGLGTTTPSEKLHVVGNAVFANSSSPNSSPFITGTISFTTASAPNYSWYQDQNCGIYHPANDQIGIATGGAETMLISSGSVKVRATTDYAPTLYVYATSTNQAGFNMRYWNGTTLTDNFWVQANGDAWSHGSVLTSDIHLKKDIRTIDNALSKVMKLRGVTYNWQDEKADPNRALGLIAQEVETVVPEAVRTSHEGTKGIEYANLVGLLVEAIKEQQDQIEELKQKVQDSNAAMTGTGTIITAEKSSLAQNSPNPFAERTQISYYIAPTVSQASIYIYNMNGLQLKEFKINATGQGSITIEGSTLEAGMYMYTLVADKKEIETKRMILTK